MIRIVFGLLLFGAAITDTVAAHHHEIFGVSHNGVIAGSFLEYLGASLLIAYGLKQIARGER